MKNNLLFILVAWFFIASAQAQNPVPNPSFENWTDGNPDLWYVINIPSLAIPITEVSPGHTGNKALKSEVIDFLGNPLFSPVQSHVDEHLNGFPVSQNYSNLRLFYKFHPVGGDDLKIAVFMLDENGISIGFQEHIISEPAENFTEINIPIPYEFSGEVERCLISMVIEDLGLEGEDIGSYFIVDDVELNNGATPTQEELPNFEVSHVFPNPCSSSLNINIFMTETDHVTVGIYDMNGNKLMELMNGEMHDGNYTLQADMSGFPAGTYLCRLATSKGAKAIPFRVVR
jgi:Secretion system C-terminal sorting domain